MPVLVVGDAIEKLNREGRARRTVEISFDGCATSVAARAGQNRKVLHVVRTGIAVAGVIGRHIVVTQLNSKPAIAVEIIAEDLIARRIRRIRRRSDWSVDLNTVIIIEQNY